MYREQRMHRHYHYWHEQLLYRLTGLRRQIHWQTQQTGRQTELT